MCSILSQELQNFATRKISQKSSPYVDINELLLIQQQSDLISELMKNNSNSGKSHTISTFVSDQSIQSIHHKRTGLNHSLSSVSFCREYSKYFDDEPCSPQQILREIRQYCSNKTYNFIRNKLRSSNEFKQQSRLQREIKHNQQLMQKCLKLTQQVAELKLKLESANEKLKSQTKQRASKISPLSLQRGEALLKWQKSLLYKQKIQAQMKKNLNKQFNTLQQQQKVNEQLRADLQNIVAFVTQNTQIKQLNEQLLLLFQNIRKQRVLVQNNQNQFFKTQKNMEDIISQFKKGVKNSV